MAVNIMDETMKHRTADLVALLDHDYTYAATRASLAEALGLTVGQVGYLLNPKRHPEAWEAWDKARSQIRSDRCATRRCAMCGLVKPAGEFPVDRRDGCGIGRRCKPCARLASKLYRQRQS